MMPFRLSSVLFRFERYALAGCILMLLAGCVELEVGTGAFRNAALIEMQLQRGVSGKADVLALAGVPNGYGSSQFANVAGGPREIWYYEDIGATNIAQKRDAIQMDMRQQILLIFFDGYLWTTTRAPASFR